MVSSHSPASVGVRWGRGCKFNSPRGHRSVRRSRWSIFLGLTARSGLLKLRAAGELRGGRGGRGPQLPCRPLGNAISTHLRVILILTAKERPKYPPTVHEQSSGLFSCNFSCTFERKPVSPKSAAAAFQIARYPGTSAPILFRPGGCPGSDERFTRCPFKKNSQQRQGRNVFFTITTKIIWKAQSPFCKD